MNFPREDSPSPVNQRKIFAYVILVHALIEKHMETLANNLISRYEQNSINPTRKSLLDRSMFAYAVKKFDGAKDSGHLDDRLAEIVRSYKVSVTENNGIKARDFLRLLLPLGVPFDQLDTDFIGTLEYIGSLRGDIAHGNQHKIKRALDREDIIRKFEIDILPHIESVQDYLSRKYAP